MSTARSAPAAAAWSHLAIQAVIVFAVAMSAVAVSAQFTPFTHNSRAILEGNWQSCREGDGHYSERVYDHVVNGVPKFEVHLGPRREFAIFEGVRDDHRDHDSPENLLSPYRLPLEDGYASHEWKIPSLNVVFKVTLAGGSRGDCDSWFITLLPLDKSSH